MLGQKELIATSSGHSTPHCKLHDTRRQTAKLVTRVHRLNLLMETYIPVAIGCKKHRRHRVALRNAAAGQRKRKLVVYTENDHWIWTATICAHRFIPRKVHARRRLPGSSPTSVHEFSKFATNGCGSVFGEHYKRCESVQEKHTVRRVCETTHSLSRIVKCDKVHETYSTSHDTPRAHACV